MREDQVVYVSPHATMSLTDIMNVTHGKRVIIALYDKSLPLVPTDIDGRRG